MKKVIVIGAGASGIMAAIQAARRKAEVCVLESERKPLKKLLLTGNGRCNLTNMYWDGSVLRTSCLERAYSVINNFDHRQTIAFFEEIGVYTKERGSWVYPISDSAKNVAKLLLHETERLGVKIKTNERVVDISKTQEGFCVKSEGWSYMAERVIVSTGSSASVEGDAYRLSLDTARRFGIKAFHFLPALTALKSPYKELGKCSGVRFDGKAALFVRGSRISETQGQLQLTSYGISGIPVFELSRYAVKGLCSDDEVFLSIDFLPVFDEEELFRLICSQRQGRASSNLKLILCGLLPEKIAEFISSISADSYQTVKNIKDFILPINGYLNADKAQACMGGIDLAALSDSMEAVNCKGLFFTGEAVDVDGSCGGYNLQWAWSSGYVAGRASAL